MDNMNNNSQALQDEQITEVAGGVAGSEPKYHAGQQLRYLPENCGCVLYKEHARINNVWCYNIILSDGSFRTLYNVEEYKLSP